MADTELIFWDWNGTLMDDVAFSCQCLNGLLGEYGYPQRYALGQYREVFGFPIEAYYRRVGFDFGRDPFPVLAESYMDLYNAGVDGCPLTAGAADALAALAGRCRGQVLLSVSRRDYLVQQAAARGVAPRFADMLGLTDIHGAGKVELGRSYMNSCGADPARCVMIGDTDHDAETARAMGVRCILYAGGHQARARLAATGCPVVDRLGDVPALL